MLRNNYRSELKETRGILNEIHELKSILNEENKTEILNSIRQLEIMLINLELEKQISFDEIDLFVQKCAEKSTYEYFIDEVFCQEKSMLQLKSYSKEDVKATLLRMNPERKTRYYGEIFFYLEWQIVSDDYDNGVKFDYNELIDFRKYIMFLVEASTISLENYQD